MSDQAGGVAALIPPGRNPCPTSPGIRKQDLCVVGQMQPRAFRQPESLLNFRVARNSGTTVQEDDGAG
jgi:hypothetical protein